MVKYLQTNYTAKTQQVDIKLNIHLTKTEHLLLKHYTHTKKREQCSGNKGGLMREYKPVCGLIRILPGGMPAASKGSKKKLALDGATCPLMPPSKERELLVLTVG